MSWFTDLLVSAVGGYFANKQADAYADAALDIGERKELYRYQNPDIFNPFMSRRTDWDTGEQRIEYSPALQPIFEGLLGRVAEGPNYYERNSGYDLLSNANMGALGSRYGLNMGNTTAGGYTPQGGLTGYDPGSLVGNDPPPADPYRPTPGDEVDDPLDPGDQPSTGDPGGPGGTPPVSGRPGDNVNLPPDPPVNPPGSIGPGRPGNPGMPDAPALPGWSGNPPDQGTWDDFGELFEDYQNLPEWMQDAIEALAGNMLPGSGTALDFLSRHLRGTQADDPGNLIGGGPPTGMPWWGNYTGGGSPFDIQNPYRNPLDMIDPANRRPRGGNWQG